MILAKTNPAVEPSADERRSSVRHPALAQVAKIRLEAGREELCLLCDISAEGVRAQVYVPLAVGARIEVELRTAHSAKGCVVWSADNFIGVRFDAPIPAAAMLAHCSFEATGNLRPPRLKVNLRGLFRIGAAAKVVGIDNISQAGLQIEAPERLAIGTACTIALPGLSARAATICWWREGNAGLMLVEPFDYATFANWRAASYR